MAEIHHFDHGWITPAVSYVLSVLGSLLGLTCAVRLRTAPSAGWRVWWLALAAVAIGGTGIWTMHFVAMLGFSVVGLPIRYDVGVTALSAVLAVLAVGTGLFIVTHGDRIKAVRIVTGGLFAGLGVAAMHFTGMYAMHFAGSVSYDTGRVIAAIAIAVVAATVALWLTVTVRRPSAIVASALVMGVAVNGMHFTGMSAMSVRQHAAIGTVSGATSTSLLVPIGLGVVFGVLGLAYALMAAPTEEDRAGAAYLASRLEREGGTAGPAPARGAGPTRGGDSTFGRGGGNSTFGRGGADSALGRSGADSAFGRGGGGDSALGRGSGDSAYGRARDSTRDADPGRDGDSRRDAGSGRDVRSSFRDARPSRGSARDGDPEQRETRADQPGDGRPELPAERGPNGRRLPTSGTAWTYRDRTGRQ